MNNFHVYEAIGRGKHSVSTIYYSFPVCVIWFVFPWFFLDVRTDGLQGKKKEDIGVLRRQKRWQVAEDQSDPRSECSLSRSPCILWIFKGFFKMLLLMMHLSNFYLYPKNYPRLMSGFLNWNCASFELAACCFLFYFFAGSSTPLIRPPKHTSFFLLVNFEF